MTIEEARVLAEQGNIGAMMTLADCLSKEKNDEEAINEAFHYYELAANAGEPQAVIKMAQTSSTMADVAFSAIESGKRIDLMDADVEKAYHWAKRLDETIRSLNIKDNDTEDFVKENLLKAISRLATLYYFDKEYGNVIRITRNVKHPYAQAIYGLALYQLANTDSEIEAAFDALKNIESDLCWKKEYQTKYGQILLVEAATYLSALFRVIYHDVDSAYRIMSCVETHSINESIRQDIRENMSKHFKKKLLGGYTYIE